MKLTKAQRLFMKAGEAQAEINYWKWVDQGSFADDNGPDCSEPIAIRKKLRKQLIREALEAANNEWWATYEEGEKEGIAKATFGCSSYE